MFYQWSKRSYQGSCEHASFYYLVAGMSISQGSRDHPPGAILKGSIYHSSLPRVYPCSDPNFEGPKDLSRQSGGTSQAKPLLLLWWKVCTGVEMSRPKVLPNWCLIFLFLWRHPIRWGFKPRGDSTKWSRWRSNCHIDGIHGPGHLAWCTLRYFGPTHIEYQGLH